MKWNQMGNQTTIGNVRTIQHLTGEVGLSFTHHPNLAGEATFLINEPTKTGLDF